MAGAFLAYAVSMGWLGDRLLDRVTSRIGSPTVAVWVWHSLALSVLTALGIGLSMTAHDVWEHGVSWLVHADKSRVHTAYAGPKEVSTAWNLALVVLLTLGATAAGSAFTHIRRLRRACSAHRLLPIETSEPLTGSPVAPAPVAVIPEHTPMVYCLPGRGVSRRIVVTTGARDLLSDNQLEAALEHERAHLARSHHHMVLIAEVVAAALRLPRLLQHYPRAVRLLVELEADDRAARKHGAHMVAAALLEISCPPTPDGRMGLAMGATATTFRIRRLLDQQRASRRAGAAMLLPAAIVLSVAPTVAAVVPVINVVGSAHWPEEASPAVSSGDFTHHP